MSQKRTPTLLRAAIRFNTLAYWNSSLADFSPIFWNDFMIRKLLRIMLLYRDFILSSHNTYVSYYSSFNSITLSLPLTIANFRESVKNSPVSFVNNRSTSDYPISCKLANLRIYLQPETKNYRNLLFSDKITGTGGLMIGMPSATVVADFIATQIKLPNNLKCLSFRRGLQNGISGLCRVLILRGDSTVLVGVRISCFGKWSKTKAGRKQKMSLTVGKLNSTTISSPLTYAQSTVVTKYGTCSVKVWLNFRSFVA